MWTASEKYPNPTVAHYRRVQRLQAAALRRADRYWAHVDPGHISESWAALLPHLTRDVTTTQLEAATAGATYGAAALAATGTWEPPAGFLDPRALAGRAPDGADLAYMLYTPARTAKIGISRGMTERHALTFGRDQLRALVKTTVTDAARVAAGADMAARPRVQGYTRMLNPPSCPRCVVLAGRFYRWNAGFRRHPNCDCVHQPVAGRAAAEAEGLVSDPYEYFGGLTPAEQDHWFGKANAQAIRDGADLNQVVNAQRGTGYAGISKDGTRRGQRRTGTTTEGTSKRGYATWGAGVKGSRVTPEAIYQQAGNDRDKAIALLERNGYIVPGGQVPGGSIIGDREGLGALGRGGARRGASEAVRAARATGVRDPRQRATMTEAERRRSDATLRWEAVLAGRNPYGRGPLTPALAATAETDFRRIVVLGDEAARLTTKKAAREAG